MGAAWSAFPTTMTTGRRPPTGTVSWCGVQLCVPWLPVSQKQKQHSSDSSIALFVWRETVCYNILWMVKQHEMLFPSTTITGRLPPTGTVNRHGVPALCVLTSCQSKQTKKTPTFYGQWHSIIGIENKIWHNVVWIVTQHEGLLFGYIVTQHEGLFPRQQPLEDALPGTVSHHGVLTLSNFLSVHTKKTFSVQKITRVSQKRQKKLLSVKNKTKRILSVKTKVQIKTSCQSKKQKTSCQLQQQKRRKEDFLSVTVCDWQKVVFFFFFLLFLTDRTSYHISQNMQ